MKYSLAGHSCIKEVDEMHQEIEVTMRVTEFYSPLSFLRILLKVNINRPYHVIQMKSENFKDFQNSSKMLQFSNVPYNKVFQLKCCKDDLHTVEYKLSHSNTDFHQVSIGKKSRQSCRSSKNIHPVQVIEIMPGTDIKILISRKQKCDKKLSQAKNKWLKIHVTLDTPHWQEILRLYWHNWTMKFLLPNDKHWLMISFTTSLKF